MCGVLRAVLPCLGVAAGESEGSCRLEMKAGDSIESLLGKSPSGISFSATGFLDAHCSRSPPQACLPLPFQRLEWLLRLMVGSDGAITLLSLCLRVFMLEASGELFHSFKNTILRVGKRTQWMQVLPLSQMTRVQSLDPCGRRKEMAPTSYSLTSIGAPRYIHAHMHKHIHTHTSTYPHTK